jgi:LmbE family N-acetylglucosaminyl deacetylase
MLTTNLFDNATSPTKILCLGAHSDDIEIGCGGTILEIIDQKLDLEITWVVFSSGSDREREARASAELFLEGVSKKNVIVHRFRDGYFPYDGTQIKDAFEALKKQVSPDLIFTHYRHDRHQDHRLISDLAWNTWRSHLILEYEVPKYDGDLGVPNCFVPLNEKVCEQKIKYICQTFQSQSNKAWLTEDTFWGILRLRGVECASPERYAEAFYSRKMVCSFGKNDK